jgi:hypothetical protein
MNFTFQQKLSMTIGFVGAATSAFGALGPLLTPTETLIGTVIFGFVSACLAVVGTVTSSQSAQVQAVAALPGVEKVVVNAKANQPLAQQAVDQSQSKVVPLPEAASAVQATAKAS